MTEVSVKLTNKKPIAPKADFAFCIDFDKRAGSATRVFAATHDFIKACEKLDRVLIQSIDSNIQTVMMLEDIEVGSIKTWLKSQLTVVDDQALKNLDWRQIVGAYLVKAKYAVLEWMDSNEENKDITLLSKQLQQIAAQTDVRHLPDYKLPSPQSLMEPIKDFQNAKNYLIETDRALLITESKELEINLTMKWDVETLESFVVKEIIKQPATTMVLVVKKPDYLGDSMWELRHGRRNIQAKILDQDWLLKFQSRSFDIRPGDALKCVVEIENHYGHDNELLYEKYVVNEVKEVLINNYNNQELLFT